MSFPRLAWTTTALDTGYGRAPPSAARALPLDLAALGAGGRRRPSRDSTRRDGIHAWTAGGGRVRLRSANLPASDDAGDRG